MNPSLDPLMHEGPSGSNLAMDKVWSPGSNGTGIAGSPRMRIPIERRSVSAIVPFRNPFHSELRAHIACETRMLITNIRYFSPPPKDTVYPPEVHDYNDKFTELLQNIKKRHDPTVTTVAQGVLEWKRKRGDGRIDQSIQEWLDRFYMSRIGIRFLIGQRTSPHVRPFSYTH